MILPIIEYFDESTCLFFYHQDEILLWTVLIDLLAVWNSKISPELTLMNLWDISEPFFDRDKKKYELMFRWCGEIKVEGDFARIDLDHYGMDARVLEWFTPLRKKYIFGEIW